MNRRRVAALCVATAAVLGLLVPASLENGPSAPPPTSSTTVVSTEAPSAAPQRGVGYLTPTGDCVRTTEALAARYRFRRAPACDLPPHTPRHAP